MGLFLPGCQVSFVVRTYRLNNSLPAEIQCWMESVTSNNCTDEETEARERQWLLPVSRQVRSKAGKPGLLLPPLPGLCSSDSLS